MADEGSEQGHRHRIEESEVLGVHALAVWLPVSDEDIVDWQIGTAEDQAAASSRIEARRIEAERRWRSLPWWVRLWRSWC